MGNLLDAILNSVLANLLPALLPGSDSLFSTVGAAWPLGGSCRSVVMWLRRGATSFSGETAANSATVLRVRRGPCGGGGIPLPSFVIVLATDSNTVANSGNSTRVSII
jgi:hypothetical protein